ncbi:unnamed protein product, partial [Candidula unifasciata]
DDVVESEEEAEDTSGPDFNYILGMPLWNLTKEKKDELCKQRDLKAEELRLLRTKTPKDLWRDDLEALLVVLDEVERMEKDTGTAEKPKVKKPLVDVMPSPMGRRVVPKISSALKAKGEKDAARKTFKDRINTEEMEDGDTRSSSFDAVKVEEDGVSVTSARGRGGGRGGRGRGRGGASGVPKSRKQKKKNPWSDSEESDISNVSDLDDTTGFGSDVVIPRDTARRAAAKKVSYTFDNEEEVESDEDVGGFVAYDPETGVMANENGAAEYLDADLYDDDGEDNPKLSIEREKPKPKPEPKPAKAAANKKTTAKPATKKVLDLSDLSGDSGDEDKPSRAALSNKELYPLTDDDDEDDIFKPKPASKPLASKTEGKGAGPKKAVKKIPALALDDNGAKPAKKAPAKKRAKEIVIDSDSDSFIPAKKAAKGKKKVTKNIDSDDENDMIAAPLEPRAPIGRAKAAVKYNFSSDDEDFE